MTGGNGMGYLPILSVMTEMTDDHVFFKGWTARRADAAGFSTAPTPRPAVS
jgi:hypothetical protein